MNPSMELDHTSMYSMVCPVLLFLHSLCKHQKGLEFDLPKVRQNENLDVVFDSTGLKVYGEGEVRQHGYVKKRLWRKLHLAINVETQETPGKLLLK